MASEPHLGRHRNVGRHRSTHCSHDGVQHFRRSQQHRAAAVPVDHFGGTPEVQVDAMRRERGGLRGIPGQPFRITAQQLDHHRRAAEGTRAVADLGRLPLVGALGQQGARHADELRHAAVVSAGMGQDVAHDKVRDPFHGGKQ
jgi:hypothetical protein